MSNNGVFSSESIDFLKQPLFFGDGKNVARYDVQQFPVFEKLTVTQLGFFWRPEEVDVSKDIRDFKRLTEQEKHIFLSNIKYQILLDSIQGRSPFIALMPYVNVPELEVCIGAWGFFEQIHSRSYTYIIKNIISSPSEIFNSIMTNDAILVRAHSVTKYYDDFIEYAQWYTLDKTSGNYTYTVLMQKLILMLISIYILEGVRFYVSFACSFAFGELEMMEGNAKILSLIARDENIHLSITQNIIKLMNQTDPIFESEFKALEPIMIDMFKDAIQEEKDWAHYLFEGGSIIGLNEKLLASYVDYIASKRMKNIKLKPLNNTITNPLSWTSKWLNSKGKQNALQETEQESYVIGGIDMSGSLDTLSSFQL